MRANQHQHRLHASAKKNILRAWDQSDQSVEIDGSNADHVQALLEDLEIRRNQIVALLRTELADNKLQQEEALSAGLMKLPKAIRQMTVREFNQAQGCDIISVLKSKDGVQLAPPKKRDFNMTVLETPAPRSRNGHAPNSILRTARRGEGLYSANGSPVESHEAGTVVATITKKRKGNDAGASIEINVGDGKFISLNNPSGVTELDSSMKASAASQLKVLQDQMQSLMAQLTS